MKVYLIDDAIINLEQVQYINTVETGRNNITLWFHFKNTAKSVAATVPKNQANNVLRECFELMKKED